jgi:hypothetical protein
MERSSVNILFGDSAREDSFDQLTKSIFFRHVFQD